MAEPRLIFTGNVIVDIVMTIDALPELGGDTIATSSGLTPGGGYNSMVAASRDGLGVVFTGQYGTGPFGDIVRAALDASGFEVVSPGLPDSDSGYCVALVDQSGERTFITSVGAEGQLSRAVLDLTHVNPSDLVYVSGYSLAHPCNAQALPAWLESLPAEVRVITDPSPLIGELDPAILERVLSRTDLLSINARESFIATGLADLPARAQALRERLRPGGSVLLRDGSNGCWVATVEDTVLVPGFPVKAVDTNGAGDAHGGVLAAALSRGANLVAAVERANAAAALAVTRRGPATAPSRSEIDQLLLRTNRQASN